MTLPARIPGVEAGNGLPRLLVVPVWLVVFAAIAFLALSARSHPEGTRPRVPAGAGFTETVLATGFQSPTAIAAAPDGRIFVCEQSGALRMVRDGTLLPAPFLQLTVDNSGERGLLGVAFDPNFAVSPYVYVYY